MDKSAISLRLRLLENFELAECARRCLEQEDTRSVFERPPRFKVSQPLPLLRTRRDISRNITKVAIKGIDSLIGALEQLPSDREVNQFAFVGSKKGANSLL